MQKTLYKAVVLFLFSSINLMYAQVWQMKQARIMTPWFATIDTANVLPEYPRPQMVRESWMNLNGVWNFTQAQYYHQTVFNHYGNSKRNLYIQIDNW